MGVGFPMTKLECDARAGQLALQLRDVLGDIKNFKATLDAKTDTELQNAPFSYTAGEVATLRSSYVDLAKLADIYNAAATQATTYDFKTFAKLLIGFQ